MYLTAEQYATYAGEAAPSDFDSCLDMAESLVDLHTMNFYAQVTVSALPAVVQTMLKRAVAYQVQAISQTGGIAGMTEPQVQSASAGKVSFSMAPRPALCAPAALCIPYLLAYARGYEG
jgi:hypothetical protein